LLVKDEQNKSSVSFEIFGEPASKANSRRMVLIGGKPRLIKSKKALDYCKMFSQQCPVLDELIECDVEVTIEIFYASRRPDLDESVILDEMQGKIYKNDRQVRRKNVHWNLDRDNPRSYIVVTPLESSDRTSVQGRRKSGTSRQTAGHQVGVAR
jgi:hypothetical protein